MKSEKKLRVRVHLSIGILNASQDDEFESEFTADEWGAMSREEQNEYLSMVANDHASNYLDCGAWIITGDDQ